MKFLPGASSETETSAIVVVETSRCAQMVRQPECQAKFTLLLKPDAPACSNKRKSAARSAARVFLLMITTIPRCGCSLANRTKSSRLHVTKNLPQHRNVVVELLEQIAQVIRDVMVEQESHACARHLSGDLTMYR